MCGIAGILKLDGDSARSVPMDKMLCTLAHRGPDDQGIWEDSAGRVVLGHRRLSIIDLSPAGHQPMLAENAGFAISFNGEIYNYADIRAELETQGESFASTSDTEVLLKGYTRWGTAILDRLVGQFAFAIWDEAEQQLFLARDRAGEKPLYYSSTPRVFAFASEVQALADLPWVDRSIDQDAVALYLSYQYIPTPFSIYRGVRKLPPGHAMLVGKEQTRMWRYWDPLPVALEPPHKMGEEEALEELEYLLKRAVKQQMISDVPLGAFLSGGIDSSAVVALMVELNSSPVQTFTIGFDNPAFNEAEHAAAVAKHLDTDHTVEYLSEADALELIPQVPSMYGEPFADPSALPTHLVSKVARKHVTVSLSGDGGDELFGGYNRYERYERYRGLKRFADPVTAIIPSGFTRLPGRIGRLVTRLKDENGDTDYRTFVNLYHAEQVKALMGRAPATFPEFERSLAAVSRLPPRRGASVIDLQTYLPEAILAKVDRAAMSVSLEARAPFLDHRLIEWTLRLPHKFIRDKYLLKQLAYRKVPKSLLDRPKQGFGVPLRHWFRNELRDLLKEMLTPNRLEPFGIQNNALVQQFVEEHLSGQKDHSRRLWALLVLSMWGEKYGS